LSRYAGSTRGCSTRGSGTRSFAVRAIGKQLGTRLSDEQVMWLFSGNLNVARQAHSRRWETAMKEQGW